MFLEMIMPSVISAYCFAILIILLIRIRNKKKYLENFILITISIAVGLWSFTQSLYKINWIYAKLAALSVFTLGILYSYLITPFKRKNFFSVLLLISSAIFAVIPFAFKIDAKTFSKLAFLFIYPHAFVSLYILFRYYQTHKVRAMKKVAVMGSIMFFAGAYESLRVFLGLPAFPAPLIGACAFVIITGYLIVFRGYLKKEGWTDYINEVNEKETLLKEKYQILKKANIDSIIILTQTIEAKDPYTRGHCLRVRDYSKAIAEYLGLNKERLLLIEFAALLHDIGKILIPGKILNKKDKLTDKEFSVIKRHSEIGANFLKNVDYFAPIVPIIRNHHEQFDGAGYPDRLSKDEIPLESRILAVSDTFDAMTSDRPYRKALNFDVALNILSEVSGKQLDPEIVKVFIDNKLYKLTHAKADKIFLDYKLG